MPAVLNWNIFDLCIRASSRSQGEVLPNEWTSGPKAETFFRPNSVIFQTLFLTKARQQLTLNDWSRGPGDSMYIFRPKRLKSQARLDRNTYLAHIREYSPRSCSRYQSPNLLVNQNIAKKPKQLVKTWNDGGIINVLVKIYNIYFSELENI